MFHRIGPVPVTDRLRPVIIADVDRILSPHRETRTGKGECATDRLRQRREFAGVCYHVVALSFTYGGGDALGEAAALHQDADVGQPAIEAAAVPHPHHCQHCCHDNQLHSQLGAAQRPAAGGDEASRQTLQTARRRQDWLNGGIFSPLTVNCRCTLDVYLST